MTTSYNTGRLNTACLVRIRDVPMEKILSYLYTAEAIITNNELTGSVDKNSLNYTGRECPKILQNVARIRHVITQI